MKKFGVAPNTNKIVMYSTIPNSLHLFVCFFLKKKKKKKKKKSSKDNNNVVLGVVFVSGCSVWPVRASRLWNHAS